MRQVSAASGLSAGKGWGLRGQTVFSAEKRSHSVSQPAHSVNRTDRQRILTAANVSKRLLTRQNFHQKLNRDDYREDKMIQLVAAVLVLNTPYSAASMSPDSQAGGQVRSSLARNALSACLERMKWEVEKKGPLLAVDPQGTHSYYDRYMRRDTSTGPRIHPRPPSETTPLAEVMEYYGRQLMQTGSLTVLAPTEMVVLNTKLGKPDIASALSREDRMTIFEASLTEAQWKKLCGERGIGLPDLNAEQKPLFLSLLPDPLVVVKAQLKDGSFNSVGQPMTASADQRMGSRIRINRQTHVAYAAQDRPNTWITYNDGVPRPDGAELLTLEPQTVRRPTLGNYGEELGRIVPNRSKPGDLNFDTAKLDFRVALGTEPGSETALSLGDLVNRIARASGLELYADPRIASLPLWTTGGSARAGDALKALALAVSGTFRKIGPAHLLTDDLIGIGSRRAIISDWLDDAQARVNTLRYDAQRIIRAKNVDRLVDFGPGETQPLELDKMRSVRPSIYPFASSDESVLDTSTLDAGWQKLIRDDVDRGVAQRQQRDQLRPMGSRPTMPTASASHVKLKVSVKATLIVPNLGEVGEGVSFGMGTGVTRDSEKTEARGALSEPRASDYGLPSDLPVRALCISPANLAELTNLLREAEVRGFNQVWIELPFSSEEADRLIAGGVNAAKSSRIAVLPVVRPLRLRSDLMADAKELDLNIVGETLPELAKRKRDSPHLALYAGWKADLNRPGAWIRIDQPPSRLAAKKTALHFAALPGISGLVIRDSCAQGYADPGDRDDYNQSIDHQFGYVPPMRLEFLRRFGADPIDFPAEGANSSPLAELPFFPDDKLRSRYTIVDNEPVRNPGRTLAQEWNAFRFGLNSAFMEDLFNELKQRAPGLPLMLDHRWNQGTMNPGWFIEWNAPRDLPSAHNKDHNFAGPGAAIRARGGHGYVSFDPITFGLNPPGRYGDTFSHDEMRKLFWERLRMHLGQNGHEWDGLVLDLSNGSSDKALQILSYIDKLPAAQK